MTKEKYTTEQISKAVVRFVLTWEVDALQSYVTEKIYAEYMDRSRPIQHIDDLIAIFGKEVDT
tara:strand:+ start:100 stop:288 length:189 start_codon:yes stop_codon:yes gene_type:complete